MKNKEITVKNINEYIGKPILLSYGDIQYGWVGIFQSIKYMNSDEPSLEAAWITLKDCCTLINENKLIPIKNVDFDEKYISDGQLQVNELSKRQLRSYNTRVNFYKKLQTNHLKPKS